MGRRKHISIGSVGDHVDSKQEENKDGEVRSDATNSVVEYNGTTKESCVLDLPLHILEMIMKINSVDEYINYRATCKWFHLATPLIKFRNQTVRKRLQIYSSISPWLTELDKEHGIMIYKHTMIGDKYIKEKFPAVSMKNRYLYCYASTKKNLSEWIEKICYSMFGWWLCCDTNGDLLFFNPFTFDAHALPLQLHYRLKSLCFSAPPTSPHCMVIGFGEFHVFIHCVARDKSWRCGPGLTFHGITPSYQAFNVYPSIFYGCDLYVLCNKGQLNVFRDLMQHDYSSWEVVAKAPKSCFRPPAQYYLMRYYKKFLLVMVDECGKNVEVFTMNIQNSTKKWKRTSCLGKLMIYICAGVSSFCIKAKSPELENKIFFPNENGNIVFYSLESCKYHTFNGKKIEECFGNLSKTIHPRFHYAWTDPCFP